jgi:hypothetical protein
LDGYRRRYNGGEVLFANAEDQMRYCADHYPQRAGIETEFICGDEHEGWYAQYIGIDIGLSIQNRFERAGRDDMGYIGYMEADLVLKMPGGQAVLRLFHPGGGTAYATSYRPQKIVESYQGGEKPSVLVVGHFHKLGSFCVRNVEVVLAGCTQDQSRFMRKKGIEAHVGGGVLHVAQDEKGGLARVCFERLNFYDREYHLDLGEWEWAVGEALK